jgi:PAS domain-containing protein
MTPFIFFYSSSEFLAGLICLFIGIYVLSRYRQTLNIIYFLMTLAMFWIGFSEAFLRGAPNLFLASIWHMLSSVGWLLVFVLFLHFAVVLSNLKFKWLPLIYIPPVLMFLFFNFTPYVVLGFEKKFYGYIYRPSPLNLVYMAFYIVYVLWGLYYIYGVYRKGKEYYKRKQAQYVIVATLVPLVFGTLFDQVFVMLNIPSFPIGIHSLALTIGIIGYAIIRFQFLAQVSKERIAEAASRALLHPMFLTDISEKINYVNPAGSRLTGYRTDELLGKGITEVFPKKEEKLTKLKKKDGTEITVTLEVFPISRNRGYVFLARDLSHIEQLRESTRRMNQELERLIEGEQRIREGLFQFSELNDPGKVEELWQKIQKEGQEVQTTLMPIYKLMHEYSKLYVETQKARDELAEKTKEITRLNQYMAGREEVLKELEDEYNKLKGEQ